MAEQPTRIAMWSGPRNISTAMMRAFENRPDTVVTDEPLYGHYLARTGLDHPGRDAILAAEETDWRKVVARLTGPIPRGKAIWYQKHMTHHLLPEVGRDWLDRLTNCFLIRDPREVLASYVQTRADPTAADIGVERQVELFEWLRDRSGALPPVLDARDVLDSPHHMLTALCAAVGVPFSTRMLAWPAGPRASDGVWAEHWYQAVWRSTGFLPHRAVTTPLPARLMPLVEAVMPDYLRLYDQRLGQ
jgi:hypothetical protein